MLVSFANRRLKILRGLVHEAITIRTLSADSFFKRADNNWEIVWQVGEIPWETDKYAPGIKDIDKKLKVVQGKSILVPGSTILNTALIDSLSMVC